MDTKNIGKQIMKWAPVIGMAIITSIIDQKKSDKERADLKKEILKELRKEMERNSRNCQRLILAVC